MHTFTHNKQTFILINGKEYFLIRYYHVGGNDPAFLQVYGKTPLHIEDLPTDNWQLTRTKTKGMEYPIFTAFNPKHFDYSMPTNEDTYKRLLFIGMTAKGSLFVALHCLSQMYGIRVDLQEVVKRYDGNKPHIFDTVNDDGNAGVTAICLEFGTWKMNRERAEKILTGGTP
jgi:hypothetical protein